MGKCDRCGDTICTDTGLCRPCWYAELAEDVELEAALERERERRELVAMEREPELY